MMRHEKINIDPRPDVVRKKGTDRALSLGETLGVSLATALFVTLLCMLADLSLLTSAVMFILALNATPILLGVLLIARESRG